MKLSSVVTSLSIATCALAQKILLTNDDSWAATNIRATYYKLKEAGHDVLMVAPASQRSGWGGKFDMPPGNKLQTDGEFSYVKAGDPAWGHEVDDDHIWYFNGTPASCVAFALNYVQPYYFKNSTSEFDLVVAGPNEGTNMSPGTFTLSGTVGATYNAIYRGLPAIAFSGSNSNNSFFKDNLNMNDTNSPPVIYANLVVDLVEALFEAQGDLPRALPLGVGMNVNFPPVGSQASNCSYPEYMPARLTGAYARGFDLAYNATSNTVGYKSNAHLKGNYACHNGDCSLPTENFIVEQSDCQSSVSVFSTDYDANLQLTQEAMRVFNYLS